MNKLECMIFNNVKYAIGDAILLNKKAVILKGITREFLTVSDGRIYDYPVTDIFDIRKL